MSTTRLRVPTTAATAAFTPPLPAAFDGRFAPLLRLCLKNAGLIILTLSVYRFWARTRERRYFWGNTRICGDHLEYTGTGGELFRGFAIVFVVYLLIVAGVGAAQGFFGALDVGALDVGGRILVGAVVGTGVVALRFAAMHRKYMYQVSRTRFRGIALHLGGSTWRFTGIALLYTILVVLTLGVALPWMRVALAREVLSNVRIGSEAFTCTASGRDLLGAWLRHLAIFACGIAGCVWAAFEWPPLAVFVGVPAVLVVFTSYVAYRVREARYLAARLRFDDARFTSELRVGTTARIVGTYHAALILIVGIAGAIAASVSGTPDIGRAGANPEVVSNFALVVFVLWLVVAPTLRSLLYDLPLARHVFATLTIEHPEAFDRATQDATSAGPRRGEGLADILGI